MLMMGSQTVYLSSSAVALFQRLLQKSAKLSLNQGESNPHKSGMPTIFCANITPKPVYKSTAIIIYNVQMQCSKNFPSKYSASKFVKKQLIIYPIINLTDTLVNPSAQVTPTPLLVQKGQPNFCYVVAGKAGKQRTTIQGIKFQVALIVARGPLPNTLPTILYPASHNNNHELLPAIIVEYCYHSLQQTKQIINISKLSKNLIDLESQDL
eukprot:TRINITY_DN11706_c0_g2_i2.p2 TRINITY_DN11706_c0_g2~~TRINITY_DN11706_c0_g2_i2.p2  ORF type:complete len:210 (+),score=4.37 TRINITY_DN11706_c0_g2_i2:420-1049(+)